MAINRERLLFNALGALYLLGGTLNASAAIKADMLPNQQEIAPINDLITNGPMTERELAVQSSVIAAGSGIVGLMIVGIPVLSRRREHQTHVLV